MNASKQVGRVRYLALSRYRPFRLRGLATATSLDASGGAIVRCLLASVDQHTRACFAPYTACAWVNPEPADDASCWIIAEQENPIPVAL